MLSFCCDSELGKIKCRNKVIYSDFLFKDPRETVIENQKLLWCPTRINRGLELKNVNYWLKPSFKNAKMEISLFILNLI